MNSQEKIDNVCVEEAKEDVKMLSKDVDVKTNWNDDDNNISLEAVKLECKRSHCLFCGHQSSGKVSSANEGVLSNFYNLFQYYVNNKESKEEVWSLLQCANYCDDCIANFIKIQSICSEIESLYFQVSTMVLACKNKLQSSRNDTTDNLVKDREQLFQYIDQNPVIQADKENHIIAPMVICMEVIGGTGAGSSQEDSHGSNASLHLSSASDSDFANVSSPEESESDSEEEPMKPSKPVARKRPVRRSRRQTPNNSSAEAAETTNATANVKLKKAVVRLERVQLPVKPPQKKRGRPRTRPPKVRKQRVKPQKNEKGMLVCPYCGKEFNHRHNIRLHIIKTHPETLPSEKHIPCKVEGCDIKFQNAVDRDVHIRRVHTDYKPYNCRFCHQAFASAQAMRFHENTKHTQETPYECKVCSVKFPNYNKLTRHMRTHGGIMEKSVQCEECGKSFFTMHEFRQHANVHNRPFVCDYCGRSFTALVYLREHLPSHPESNLARPLCKYCGKVFKSTHYLRIHEGIHEGEYKYKCDKCDFGTMKKCRMKEHAESHETGFECNTCGGLKFALQSQFRDHNKLVHNIQEFECSMCGKSFHARQNLLRHIKRHSNGEPSRKIFLHSSAVVTPPQPPLHLSSSLLTDNEAINFAQGSSSMHE